MTLQSGWITTFLTLWKSPEKRAKFSQLKCNELLHWEDESHPWGWIQRGINMDKFRSVFNLLTHPFQGGIFITFKGCFSPKTRWFLFFFNRYKGWKFYPKQINFLHLSGWNTGWFFTPKGLTVTTSIDGGDLWTQCSRCPCYPQTATRRHRIQWTIWDNTVWGVRSCGTLCFLKSDVRILGKSWSGMVFFKDE